MNNAYFNFTPGCAVGPVTHLYLTCVFIARNRPVQRGRHHISAQRSPVCSGQMIISHHSRISDKTEHPTQTKSLVVTLEACVFACAWLRGDKETFTANHCKKSGCVGGAASKSNSSLCEHVTGPESVSVCTCVETLQFFCVNSPAATSTEL